jgi:hypothetical protein
MRSLFGILILISAGMTQAQNKINNSSEEELPYASIPEYTQEYTAGTVSARLVDGLGFRYYWATEGLRTEDLLFKPSEEARTIEETIDHIYGLSAMLKNATLHQANSRSNELANMTFEQKREATLANIKVASDILRESTEEQIASYKIVFERKEGSTTEYPFWNMLNGPIADAIWHVGQVVSHRRTSGNPFNSKVNVLSGRLRD